MKLKTRISLRIVVFASALLSACSEPGENSTPQLNVAIAGPIQGGERGYPYASSIVDLEHYGYSEEEFFISGRADSFKPKEGVELSDNGQWDVVPAESMPYTTRVLVRKPAKNKFNGTVVVEFMQEYFGSERDTNYRWSAETLLREGFAWVGVSLHHEGIDDKSPQQVFTYGDITVKTGMNLARWDEKRYGKLSVPSSDLSYDILTQVGELVKSNNSIKILGKLGVKRVLAAGNTIAAKRLGVYINAVQKRENVFDGFYLQDWTPSEVGLSKSMVPEGYQLRLDIDVPVVVMNTTTAAMEIDPQSESDYLRFWTPAGSSHTTGPYMRRVAEANLRDFDQAGAMCPEGYANNFPLRYIVGAAFVGLERWARTGEALPSIPQLKRVKQNDQWVTAFDKNGNSVGGLRTPWVDTAYRRYDWRGQCPGGSGRSEALTEQRLEALYGNPSTLHQQFANSAREAVEKGVLLPEDAEAAINQILQITW